jgi:hypothetical protein
LSNDLRRLPWAILFARHTVRVIRSNLFWAFAYNVVGIALACTGRLNPVLASLAMVLSSLFVVSNSLRLARWPGVEGCVDGSQDSRDGSRNSVAGRRETGDGSVFNLPPPTSRLPASDSSLPPPTSRLPASDSSLPSPDARLPSPVPFAPEVPAS